ncbi:MAG: hypothetical protein H6607_07495 [Flavobacteriales bacterium]|nr:hypothetical protein [Flavobacteriales bacterium]
MKKLLIIGLMAALGAAQASAQRGTHGGKQLERRIHRQEMMQHKMAELDSVVSLTDVQKSQIEVLNADFKTKMKENKGDREAMKTAAKEHRQAIKAILTPEQIEKLEAYKAAKKEDMKAMHQEMKTYRKTNIEPALKSKRAELDEVLTDAEKAKIDSLRSIYKSDFKEFGEHKRDSFSPEKRKEQMAEGKALHEQRKADLDKELKPIIAAHKLEIEKIESDLKPLQDTWKADMQAIRAKHSAGKDAHPKYGHGKMEKDSKVEMKRYHFLLMKA